MNKLFIIPLGIILCSLFVLAQARADGGCAMIETFEGGNWAPRHLVMGSKYDKVKKLVESYNFNPQELGAVRPEFTVRILEREGEDYSVVKTIHVYAGKTSRALSELIKNWKKFSDDAGGVMPDK